MERLKEMQRRLISCVECQIEHLDTVDTKELGEAIDMIKDLSETMYYKAITDVMEEGSEFSKHQDKDRWEGRMYYDGYGRRGGYHPGTTIRSIPGSDGARGHHDEREFPIGEVMRDSREGRSHLSRKMYMESKEMHKDKASQLQELEKYAQELMADMVEMIEDASPEEKQYLSNRLTALAAKIK